MANHAYPSSYPRGLTLHVSAWSRSVKPKIDSRTLNHRIIQKDSWTSWLIESVWLNPLERFQITTKISRYQWLGILIYYKKDWCNMLQFILIKKVSPVIEFGWQHRWPSRRRQVTIFNSSKTLIHSETKQPVSHWIIRSKHSVRNTSSFLLSVAPEHSVFCCIWWNKLINCQAIIVSVTLRKVIAHLINKFYDFIYCLFLSHKCCSFGHMY